MDDFGLPGFILRSLKPNVVIIDLGSNDFACG